MHGTVCNGHVDLRGMDTGKFRNWTQPSFCGEPIKFGFSFLSSHWTVFTSMRRWQSKSNGLLHVAFERSTDRWTILCQSEARGLDAFVQYARMSQMEIWRRICGKWNCDARLSIRLQCTACALAYFVDSYTVYMTDRTRYTPTHTHDHIVLFLLSVAVSLITIVHFHAISYCFQFSIFVRCACWSIIIGKVFGYVRHGNEDEVCDLCATAANCKFCTM